MIVFSTVENEKKEHISVRNKIIQEYIPAKYVSICKYVLIQTIPFFWIANFSKKNWWISTVLNPKKLFQHKIKF